MTLNFGYAALVIDELLTALRLRAPIIQRQWEILLRIEPPSSALADPETLKYLIPDATVEIFAGLAKPTRAPVSLQAAKACVPDCTCGMNPYRPFYVAAERCFIEAVVICQAQLKLTRPQTDLAEVIFVIRRMARRDIDRFCGACVNRGSAAGCRFAQTAEAPVS